MLDPIWIGVIINLCGNVVINISHNAVKYGEKREHGTLTTQFDEWRAARRAAQRPNCSGGLRLCKLATGLPPCWLFVAPSLTSSC